jgi:branched-chain amino acid transport system substrate-binding protein
MKSASLKMKALALCFALSAGFLSPAVSVAEDTSKMQFAPVHSFWTGPYAAQGAAMKAGWTDYLNLLNLRDGGINGVKLFFEECEHGWDPGKGVECYERDKHKGPTGITWINVMGVGVVYALLDKALQDKVALVSINHGRTDSTDGRVFPYAFPIVLNPWSEFAAAVAYMGQKAGGMDKLKGKKVVGLIHDSPYGNETNGVAKLLAEKYGFKLTLIPVSHPGNEQGAQWLKIRKIKPDWVYLRTWGVMTTVAIKTAVKTGYPISKVLGNVWSNSEEDVVPAGDASIGYTAIGTNPGGTGWPVFEEIMKNVYATGNGYVKDQSRIGTKYYNLGLHEGILTAEAIRTAQKRFGNKPLTGPQIRWGFENLNIDDKRLGELGVAGMMQPIKITCLDHEGGGSVKAEQWTGEKWKIVSDWIPADRNLLRPLIEESAAKYAADKGIKPRDCNNPKDRDFDL